MCIRDRYYYYHTILYIQLTCTADVGTKFAEQSEHLNQLHSSIAKSKERLDQLESSSARQDQLESGTDIQEKMTAMVIVRTSVHSGKC